MKYVQGTFDWGGPLGGRRFHPPAQTPVRVTADNVNLRAKAQLTAEVVAQANYNDQLVAQEIGEEWVEVSAPATVDLWVMKICPVAAEHHWRQPRQCPRRTQHQLQHRGHPVARHPVEPRGEEMQDWLKIAPPPSAHVWISRQYVEFLPEMLRCQETDAGNRRPAEEADKRKPGRSPANRRPEPDSALPTPIVSPSVPMKDSAVREIPVPPPADLKLIPLEGQGRFTEVEGELRAAPLINEAPTRYRVVRWQNNRWQILCHVYGEAAKFRSLQDKRVSLKGREYWIQGAAAPVLIPDMVRNCLLPQPSPGNSRRSIVSLQSVPIGLYPAPAGLIRVSCRPPNG